MIESITIKNFLSIKDEQTLSFVASNKEKDKDNMFSYKWYKNIDNNKKLLKLLILVGENGVGKTNFLQAIKYIQEIALSQRDSRSDEIRYLPFLFDNYSKKEPTEMCIVYYLENECYQYSFKTNANYILEEELKLIAGKRSSRVYFRKIDELTGLTEINFGTICDLDKEAERILQKTTITNQSVLSSFWGKNIESEILEKNHDFFENHLSQVHRSEESLADRLFFYEKKGDYRIKNLVNRLFLDIKSNITDYKVNESVIDIIHDTPSNMPSALKDMFLKKYPEGILKNRTLSFTHHTINGDYELSDGMESAGTLEILKLMIVVYDIIIGNKYSFIDEIERGIHSKALTFIIQMFLILSNDSQLVIATQDLQLMEMEFLRRDSVRWIKKNRYGESIIERINQNKVHKNKNLRNYLYDEMLSNINTLIEDNSIFNIYLDILNNDDYNSQTSYYKIIKQQK